MTARPRLCALAMSNRPNPLCRLYKTARPPVSNSYAVISTFAARNKSGHTPMLLRLSDTHARRPTRPPAGANVTLAVVQQTAAAHPETMPWPKRPSPSVLSKSIPLFFIGRDNDGFWIACEAEHRIGGVFLSQRSALRFAQRCSEPTPCATMILEETHQLDIENRGNRLVGHIRPAKRLVRRLASKLAALVGTAIEKPRAIAARWSRAYIEDRMLRAALEVELYRGRYKHSNKNDDDLPIVRRTELSTPPTTKDQSIVGGIKRAQSVITAFAIFAVILTGIIGLRAAVWLPAFYR